MATSDSLKHLSDSLNLVLKNIELSKLKMQVESLQNNVDYLFPTVISIISVFCTLVLGLGIWNWIQQRNLGKDEINNLVLELKSSNKADIQEQIKTSGIDKLSSVSYRCNVLEQKIKYFELMEAVHNTQSVRLHYSISELDSIMDALKRAIEYAKTGVSADFYIQTILVELKKYLENETTLYHSTKDDIIKLMAISELNKYPTYTADIVAVLKNISVD